MSQRDPPNSPTRKLTREQKKDVFLREFDLEVQARIERMRVNARTLGYSIRNEFSVELIKLPSKIRKLPMKTFSEIWNSFSTDQIPISTHDFSNHCSNNNNNTNTNNGLKRTNSTTQPTKQDSSSVLFSLKKQKCNPLLQNSSQQRPLLEDIKENFPLEVGKTSTVDETPLDLMRTRSKIYSDTPLITPKFDPRLPYTPALRTARKGEHLMSMNGSPISSDLGDKASLSISLGKKKHTILVPLASNQPLNIDSSLPESLGAMSKDARKEALGKLTVLQDHVAKLMAELAQ